MGCTSLTSLLLTMESKLNFWWDSCLNDWRLTSWPSSSSSSSFPIASPVFSLKRYVKQPRKWYKLLINYHYKTLKCMTHQAAMENSVWFIHSNDLLTFSQFSRHFFIFFSFLDSTTIKWKMTFLHLDSESLFNKQASKQAFHVYSRGLSNRASNITKNMLIHCNLWIFVVSFSFACLFFLIQFLRYESFFQFNCWCCSNCYVSGLLQTSWTFMALHRAMIQNKIELDV